MKRQDRIGSLLLIFGLTIAILSNLVVASQLVSSSSEALIIFILLCGYLFLTFFILNHIKEALGVVAKIVQFISTQQSKEVAGWVVELERAVEGKWEFMKGVVVIATILFFILAIVYPSIIGLFEVLR